LQGDYEEKLGAVRICQKKNSGKVKNVFDGLIACVFSSPSRLFLSYKG